MKKGILMLIVVMAVCLSVLGSAGAAILTDTVDLTNPDNILYYGWAPENEIGGTADFAVWSHDYTFDPEMVSINSATLTLTFADDLNRFGSEDLQQEWTLIAAADIDTILDWNVGVLSWAYEVNTGTYSFSFSDFSMLEEGDVYAGLAGIWGDFTVLESTLTIDYTEKVPEPSTLLLLGVGLAGLTGYRFRKLSKKK